jgi:UDP-2,3-diacylglucosamine hydrolase
MGMGLANFLSRRSRAQTGMTEEVFLGENKEWLIIYCKSVLKEKGFDFFIFGHRHLPIDFSFPNGSRYINLGDWIHYYTYAAFDGEKLELKSYKNKDEKIIRKA